MSGVGDTFPVETSFDFSTEMPAIQLTESEIVDDGDVSSDSDGDGGGDGDSTNFDLPSPEFLSAFSEYFHFPLDSELDSNLSMNFNSLEFSKEFSLPSSFLSEVRLSSELQREFLESLDSIRKQSENINENESEKN